MTFDEINKARSSYGLPLLSESYIKELDKNPKLRAELELEAQRIMIELSQGNKINKLV